VLVSLLERLVVDKNLLGEHLMFLLFPYRVFG
jgi:hypothetical protein